MLFISIGFSAVNHINS